LGLKEYILFLEIVYSFGLGGAAKLRWAGGGAKRPDGHENEPKETGARSARARMRGQNPLVGNISVNPGNNKSRLFVCLTTSVE
jgi:hypothetical protein